MINSSDFQSEFEELLKSNNSSDTCTEAQHKARVSWKISQKNVKILVFHAVHENEKIENNCWRAAMSFGEVPENLDSLNDDQVRSIEPIKKKNKKKKRDSFNVRNVHEAFE